MTKTKKTTPKWIKHLEATGYIMICSHSEIKCGENEWIKLSDLRRRPVTEKKQIPEQSGLWDKSLTRRKNLKKQQQKKTETHTHTHKEEVSE